MSLPSQAFHDESVQVFDKLRNSELWQVCDDVRIPALQNAVLIILVKNADDIIGVNLRHHYNIGFRRFFILDNNITDKTATIIKSFKFDYKEVQVFW